MLKSIVKYINDNYVDDIRDELFSFIEENPKKLGTNSYLVDNPDEAELDDYRIKNVYVNRIHESEVFFDIIVEADMIISGFVKRNRESDDVSQWFRISYSATLDSGFKNFQVNEIRIYNQYEKNTKIPYSEYLVPYISTDQLDNTAESFLAKYYPEALESPIAISPEIIAEKMGLTIKELQITKSCSVFGQIYFSDCEVMYYNSAEKSYKPADIKEGTIVVDPKVYFLRNYGCVKNTIIHECVHWDKHRAFYELQKIYNKEANSISCQVKEGIRQEKERTPLEWIEWQANALAPRILMPAGQTRIKIEELISKNKRALPDAKISDIMESVVFELSEFFEVSKIAAKIRMIDLGYKEAIGVYTYIDDRYISNFAFETAALKKGQTFTIGMQDSLYEYATNVEFRELVNTGRYLYVDAHFCINDSKYIRQNANGFAELTDYASQHIDECCLIFEITHQTNNYYGADFYSECILYKNAISNTVTEVKYGKKGSHNKTIDKRSLTLDDAKQLNKILNSLPATFSDTLKAHMERLDVSLEKLEELSQVNTKTIQRMRNKEDYDSKLKSIVAVCIGLQLNPVLSMDLIKKSGHSFKTTEEHIVYQMLIYTKYSSSIHECNEYLLENSIKPLVKEVTEE